MDERTGVADDFYRDLCDTVKRYEAAGLTPQFAIDVTCHLLASLIYSSAAVPIAEVLPLVFQRIDQILKSAGGQPPGSVVH